MALLGRTANGLFWMFRYIERAENTARLLDAGQRISLTNLSSEPDEWQPVLVSAGVEAAYNAKYQDYDAETVIDFMLCDRDNPSSVRSSLETARTNGRMVRTALTRELWEAVNESWLVIQRRLSAPVSTRELPAVIDLVKRQGALIRGAFQTTMLRNEIFDFCNLGAFIERADNTARILDVKYWLLLPEHSQVGSALDNFQWRSILRSVSAHRAYAWEYDGEYQAVNIIDFLMLNRRMPRSLAHCYHLIAESLGYLDRNYEVHHPCHNTAMAIRERLAGASVRQIIDGGLHEFLEGFIRDNNRLAQEIGQSYRFYPGS
ncbi:alpha-E domain-containing protein [Jiella sp. MQZ9-1]|uniref:Alpha-E domain-containing protein n=1 Tax=Jiella flava TaxID=2816857 RepID=A0A939JU63_9HYPH|nr:alpha-E domain-containing protein [Jiella flava]MBO0661099.1 alpha-E domain-containing protein [Jiella flava]MCD2469746.1 alpha-E domain-containing protein [Jiella flava]